MSTKISNLPTLATINGTEKLPVGNNSTTASAITTAALKQYCTPTAATQSSSGLLSATDKTKLDGIEIKGIKVVTTEVSANDNILYIVVS